MSISRMANWQIRRNKYSKDMQVNGEEKDVVTISNSRCSIRIEETEAGNLCIFAGTNSKHIEVVPRSSNCVVIKESNEVI